MAVSEMRKREDECQDCAGLGYYAHGTKSRRPAPKRGAKTTEDPD